MAENENMNEIVKDDRIIKVDIDKQMRSSYIDYSMSVIVSRALPDARDGMKPVQRRVLFGMHKLGNTADKPTKKSARIVGEVMGKYHPHGDSSIYGTLVNMAQPWKLRYTMVDGQGNFGSIDGDGPAAMRYTEARLHKIAEEMLHDLEKDTVDMVFNFDNTELEPTVLPTRIPNLLVNGGAGIAVGMATNMPPHNLSEVVDGIVALIDNPEISIEELMQYIKGPDFPTGGIIYGIGGVRDAFETGRGRVVIRSKAEIEQEHNGMEKIVVREIPYQVVKADLVKTIADLVKDKKIEGISDISDHTSSKEGICIVIDIKRDANANVVLNKLYKYTALQSSFSVNNIALVKGRPRLMNLKDMLKVFVDHRMDVVTRRTQFELNAARRRAHILEGLIIAVDNIDEVVRLIRASRTPADAQRALEERFKIDDIQSKAIVDMRLSQLTGLRIDELKKEYEDLMKLIEHLEALLASVEMRMDVIKEEMLEIKNKFGDERKTAIVRDATEQTEEDFISDDEVVITISHRGYIKSTKLSEFRAQGRGGVGSRGSGSRDEDFIEYIYPATMRNTIMFFTQKGRCFWYKVYNLPEGDKAAKGRAIQNMLNIDSDDKITAVLCIPNLNDKEFVESHYLMFATKNGVVKKTPLEAYSRPRTNGVNAIVIREEDKVIEVCLTDGNSEVILANKNGRAIRFNEHNVRSMGRVSTGVRGMTLDGDDDEVIGMICLPQESKQAIVVVSQKGFGKCTRLNEVDEAGELVYDEQGQVVPVYRVTNRGGKGVKTMNITDKTGHLVAIKDTNDENDLMIINKSGVVIRLHMKDVKLCGRATQGVKLIDLQKRNDVIASVCKVMTEAEEEISDAEVVDSEATEAAE